MSDNSDYGIITYNVCLYCSTALWNNYSGSRSSFLDEMVRVPQ